MTSVGQGNLIEDRTNVFLHRKYLLIKLFPCGRDVLVYDAKAHFAFVLSRGELGVLLDFLDEKPAAEMDETHAAPFKPGQLKILLDKFADLKKTGVFIPGPVDEISPVDRSALEAQLKYYDENILLRKFCLQVTEDCNFRCTYCKRTIAGEHAKTNLSEEHAYQGIFYYFHKYTAFFDRLSTEKQALLLQIVPPTLSYYGGEPFLNFALIKKSADYFKKLPWEKHGIPLSKLNFASNTNLSIMTDEILQFLTENRVTLFASLDGPVEEHDKCRAFVNGEGTFHTAYANLLKIKDYAPDYFKDKVTIFGVYTPAHDYHKCVAFTQQLGVQKCNHFPADYTGVFVPNLSREEKFYQHAFDTDLADYKAMVRSVEKDPDSEMDRFANIFPFAKVSYDHPVGKNSLQIMLTCPMGFDNLMLAANGDYLICHKVGGQMPIGHCATGLDMEKLMAFYAQYNTAINNPACRNCWNVRFCDVCAAARLERDRFINPQKAECDLLRLRTAYAFACFSHLSLEHPVLLEKIFAYRSNPQSYIGVIDINDF